MNFLHIGLSTGTNGHAEGLRKVFNTGDWQYEDINVGTPDLNSHLIDIANNYRPDLCFIQIQDRGIPREVIETLKRNGCFIIQWSGDARNTTPVCYFEYAQWGVDLTCFSNMRDVENVRGTGYDADFLQIGYSPEIYYPDDSVVKDIDIVFMGNQFSHFPLSQLRVDMVRELKRVYGDRFKAYGTGQPDGSFMGDQPGEAAIYRRAKIGINLSHYDYPRYTSDRMFRMLGSGVCVLSHNYQGIWSDFTANQIVCWNNLETLIYKIDSILGAGGDEYVRKTTATNGHQLALSTYTFEAMGRNILKLWQENK